MKWGRHKALCWDDCYITNCVIIPEYILYKTLLWIILQVPYRLTISGTSAGISMALHHKTGSAKISKIFYKANIEQTFEMADEIEPNGVSES